MKKDDLLDQLDDDLDTLKNEDSEDFLSDEFDGDLGEPDLIQRTPDLSSDDIENVLQDHEIPASHQASMDRLEQLIDLEKDNQPTNKQTNIKPNPNRKKRVMLLILGAVMLVIIILVVVLNLGGASPQSTTQQKLQVEKNISLTSNHASPRKTTSKLIRAISANPSSSRQLPDNQLISPSKSSGAQLIEPQQVSNTELQSALDFDPENLAKEKQRQQLLKLKLINQQLNFQLKQKLKLISRQKTQLESYQNELKQVSDQVAIAGRTRIGGLQIIDFAAGGTVAVVASQYSKVNQIIALSEGEMLKLGNSSYKVEKVSEMDKRVIIGQYFYIDKSLVSQPILGLEKKPKPAQKKIKNRPKTSKERLQPIRNWTILFASQSGDYSVIASKDNRAKRLSRGDRLSPYGSVKNILRDGSIVFNKHIIQYQSTVK
ncbi:MAG: hypothetical protein Q9M92_04185 [Enterobacterales bacterium]|nr:hypothetical protein [Enterobacterales bacterium]